MNHNRKPVPNDRVEKALANNIKLNNVRSKKAITSKPMLNTLVINTLNSYLNDEIGYASALQVLKDANCTQEEIRYFIFNSMI